ncbi:MAG: hypothetical protein KA712_16165 [Myxococcales bacterium]|nr:hypothetical protein [Myxococcales bacterium]
MSVHRANYLNVPTGATEHPSLVSDPIPQFIYKKMERRWALEFVQGSVKIGSLFYYRTIKDDSGMIVDPHEGLEVCEVTEDLVTGSPMLAMISRGNPPAVGSRLRTVDDRRLVFCASISAGIPPEGLPPEYDTWVQIEAEPAIASIHQALLARVPDVDGPVFKRVIYDPSIDGPDHLPPGRPLYKILDHAMGLHDRWYTKRTKFQTQGEVRVGWLADPSICSKPIPPLSVPALEQFVRILA